jgi:hypothetical protein
MTPPEPKIILSELELPFRIGITRVSDDFTDLRGCLCPPVAPPTIRILPELEKDLPLQWSKTCHQLIKPLCGQVMALYLFLCLVDVVLGIPGSFPPPQLGLLPVAQTYKDLNETIRPSSRYPLNPRTIDFHYGHQEIQEASRSSQRTLGGLIHPRPVDHSAPPYRVRECHSFSQDPANFLDRSSQMGRRFPEFCIIRAACRVSVKASPSATGDNRVASYQAAIDAVAVQHYAHWPFMVEVLNKWLEMNQDFVRDPIGYVPPGPLPDPPTTTVDDHSFTVSTTHDAPDQAKAPVVVSGHRLAHDLPTAPLPDTFGSAISSSPAPSTTTDVSHSPSNDESDVPVPIQGIFPLSWIGAFRLLPLLVHRTSDSVKTCWLRPFFPASLYRRWRGVLERSFTFRSR